ncbi:MAG: hypothetical protein ACR65R_11420 [Methylomicrobium sp.]
MTLKTRLEKLEQRADKEISLEQINARLRVLFGKALGKDLSQSSEAELSTATDEFLRQMIEGETGQVCRDWPNHRLLSEYRKLVRGPA